MNPRGDLPERSASQFLQLWLRKLRPKAGEMFVQGHMTGYWPRQHLNQGLLTPRPLNPFSFNAPKKLGAFWLSGPGKPRMAVHVSSGASGPGNISDRVGACAKPAGGEGWDWGPERRKGDNLSASRFFQMAGRNIDTSVMSEGKQSPLLIEPLLHRGLASLSAPSLLAHTHTHTHTHTHPYLAAAFCHLQLQSQYVY